MSVPMGRRTSEDARQRAGGRPLFAQVRDDLRSHILDGSYAPGDAIPPEPELCEHYGVSRITLRRSVSDLVSEGLLDKLPGKGTFVRGASYETTLMSLKGFGRNPAMFAVGPRRRVLGTFTESVDALRAEWMGLEAGTEVVGLQRLLQDGDDVLALDTTRYPSALVPGLLGLVDDETSTFDLLQDHYGLAIGRATGEVRIGYASRLEADSLGCAMNEPVLNIDKVVRTMDGQAIVLSQLALRPHRVNIHFEV